MVMPIKQSRPRMQESVSWPPMKFEKVSAAMEQMRMKPLPTRRGMKARMQRCTNRPMRSF